MKIVMDDQRHEIEFEEVRELCPWRGKNPSEKIYDKCEAIIGTRKNDEYRSSICLQQNCAPYHFKKFFEGRK